MRKVVEQISPFDEWYTKYGPEAEVAHFDDGGVTSGTGLSWGTGSGLGLSSRGLSMGSGSGSSWNGKAMRFSPTGSEEGDAAYIAANGLNPPTSDVDTVESYRQQAALEAAAAKYDAEKARTDAIAGLDSIVTGDPGDDRMGDPAMAEAYARALIGTDNPPKSAYETLVSMGYGNEDVNPNQTISQALASIKTNEFLTENLWPAAKVLLSTVPGMSPAIALAEAAKGLATGTQSIGGIAVNTAMNAVAERLGINPAVFTNVINGDFGGAFASYAKSELAGEIASTIGIPRALVNLTMNKSGLNSSIDSSISNFAAEHLGLVKPTERFTNKVAFGINDVLGNAFPSIKGLTGNVTAPADPTQISSSGSSPEWTYKGSSNVATAENIAKNQSDLANFGKIATLDALNSIPAYQTPQKDDTPNAAQVSLYDWASPLGNKPGLYDWSSPLGNKQQAAAYTATTPYGRKTNTAVPYANMAAGGTVRTEHDDVTEALINILRG